MAVKLLKLVGGLQLRFLAGGSFATLLQCQETGKGKTSCLSNASHLSKCSKSLS